MAVFGIASILTMIHADANCSSCPEKTGLFNTMDAGSGCVDYHLGLLQMLSSSNSPGSPLLFISLILTGWLAFLLLEKLFENFKLSALEKFKSELFDPPSNSFSLKLLSWLKAIEKSDPLLNFA